MSACAYRLGMAFGGEAERATDTAQKVEWFGLFERCFFSVRVATALELRLRREARTLRGFDAESESNESEYNERPDPAEREDRQPVYDERDREGDREVERASFPLLLRTLDGVVADAERLPGPQPAGLPTLREVLEHARSSPGAATGPKRPDPLRNRLSGSSAPLLSPSAPRLASNVGAVLAARRATGPPRR